MQLQRLERRPRAREVQRPISHLSVSQLKEYLRCPRKYFFHYVDGAEPEFRSVALAFGSAWHHMLGEVLVRRPTIVSVEEAQAIFRDALVIEVQGEGEDDNHDVPVLFDTDEQNLPAVIDRGVAMVEVFFDRVALPEEVLGVEVAFAIELTDPITGGDLPAPLVGGIDALGWEDGRAVVWEFKTSAKRWSRDQLEYDIQPTAYKVAARSLGHADPLLRLTVATKGSKPDVQVEDLVRGRRDERELAEIAIGVMRSVRAGADHPVRGWACRSCQYAGACGG